MLFKQEWFPNKLPSRRLFSFAKCLPGKLALNLNIEAIFVNKKSGQMTDAFHFLFVFQFAQSTFLHPQIEWQNRKNRQSDCSEQALAFS